MSTTLPGAPPGPVTCPDCRLGIDGDTLACPRCGAALPPPGGAVWREGRTVVALRDAALPDRCVRCGDPGDGRPIRRRLYWHHPALYLLVPLWVIPYILVALAVRRSTTLRVSVCARHRRTRARALGAAWGLLAGAVVSLVVAIVLGSGLVGVLGALLLVAAPCAGIAGRRLVSASRIEERLVRVRGAGAGFLDALPDWSAPDGGVVAGTAALAPPPAPAPEGGTAALGHVLAETWPELAADRARAAEYEWALDGLSPGVVAAVAASFAAERRPLPAPAVLRMAVMARTRAQAAPATAPRRPAVTWTPPAAPTPAGSRLRSGIPMAASMAAALAAFLSVGSTWATVDGPYAHHPYRGTEVDGGPLVALATLVGLVACIAGAVIILRRGSARSVGVASAVSAGACVFGVIGALLALGDVGQARDQASTSFGPAELTDAEVTTGPGLWTALSLTSLGVVTGICGWIAMRRLDQE